MSYILNARVNNIEHKLKDLATDVANMQVGGAPVIAGDIDMNSHSIKEINNLQFGAGNTNTLGVSGSDLTFNNNVVVNSSNIEDHQSAVYTNKTVEINNTTNQKALLQIGSGGSVYWIGTGDGAYPPLRITDDTGNNEYFSINAGNHSINAENCNISDTLNAKTIISNNANTTGNTKAVLEVSSCGSAYWVGTGYSSGTHNNPEFRITDTNDNNFLTISPDTNTTNITNLNASTNIITPKITMNSKVLDVVGNDLAFDNHVVVTSDNITQYESLGNISSNIDMNNNSLDNVQSINFKYDDGTTNNIYKLSIMDGSGPSTDTSDLIIHSMVEGYVPRIILTDYNGAEKLQQYFMAKNPTSIQFSNEKVLTFDGNNNLTYDNNIIIDTANISNYIETGNKILLTNTATTGDTKAYVQFTSSGSVYQVGCGALSGTNPNFTITNNADTQTFLDLDPAENKLTIQNLKINGNLQLVGTGVVKTITAGAGIVLTGTPEDVIITSEDGINQDPIMIGENAEHDIQLNNNTTQIMKPVYYAVYQNPQGLLVGTNTLAVIGTDNNSVFMLNLNAVSLRGSYQILACIQNNNGTVSILHQSTTEIYQDGSNIFDDFTLAVNSNQLQVLASNNSSNVALVKIKLEWFLNQLNL